MKFHRSLVGGAVAISLVAFGGPLSAAAAPETGTITGVVIGYAPVGNGGAGVSVNAKNARGDVFSTRADATGHFRITGVRPGTYGIKFTDTKGHIYCDGGCSHPIHNRTEWLGDETSYSASEKVVVRAGKTTSGIREVMAETAAITGRITVNGEPPKKFDVELTIRSLDGKRRHSGIYPDEDGFGIAVRKDNYTIKVRSKSGLFPPFFITDPTDDNMVFHVNGVGKQTGVRFDIRTR